MITVVIPAYNSAETIVEALDSVVGQDLTTEYTEHTEIIVVDDCSTDDTCEVVKKWGREFEQEVTEGAEKNLKLRLIEFKENGGPARARNVGIQAAKGDWIAFLDADDAWLPDRLAVQMRVLEENPDAVMICGQTVKLTKAHTENTETIEQVGNPDWGYIGKQAGVTKGTKVGRAESVERRVGIHDVRRDEDGGERGAENRILALADFAIRNPVATSTVLVRKDVVERVGGFREQFRGPEDYDLWMRIASEYKILKIETPLSCYRHVVGSLSLDDRKFLPQVLSVLDAAYGPSGVMTGKYSKNKAVSHQLLAASWMAMERGAVLRAWSLYARGFITWPFSKGDPSFRLEKTKLAVALLRAMLRRGAVNKS